MIIIEVKRAKERRGVSCITPRRSRIYLRQVVAHCGLFTHCRMSLMLVRSCGAAGTVALTRASASCQLCKRIAKARVERHRSSID